MKTICPECETDIRVYRREAMEHLDRARKAEKENERLRAERDRWMGRVHAADSEGTAAEEEKQEALARIAAALALHKRIYWDGKDRCTGCHPRAEAAQDYPPWPCPTVKALRGEDDRG
jgi:hypothetical protein